MKEGVTNGQVIHDSTHMKHLGSQIHRERKQNGGCQGLGRGEIGVLLLNGPEFVLQDENVMGTADGDDDPTV